MGFLQTLISTVKAHGLSKEPIFDGIGYEPSEYSRALFVSKKTDYSKKEYSTPNTDKAKKILIICTEEKYLEMNNGKKFSTGNHPVETMVPMLHLQSAGFEMDIYTPTGKPVAFEMWAFPEEDDDVKALYNEYKPQFEHPKSLKDFNPANTGETDYIAVFIPGGHGALNGLPFNDDVKRVLTWSMDSGKYILSICHGPAAFLSAASGADDKSFIFNGYKINAFPDEMDKKVPEMGYTPGEMPYFFGDRLTALGTNIENEDISGACHRDRNLITGDSPLAADKFGQLCAETLLEASAL